MAKLQLTLDTREIKKKTRVIFLREVDALVESYLQTVPDDDGEEVFSSYRDHARAGLDGFVEWLKGQVGD